MTITMAATAMTAMYTMSVKGKDAGGCSGVDEEPSVGPAVGLLLGGGVGVAGCCVGGAVGFAPPLIVEV